jgi:hypothetical protein
MADSKALKPQKRILTARYDQHISENTIKKFQEARRAWVRLSKDERDKWHERQRIENLTITRRAKRDGMHMFMYAFFDKWDNKK